MATERPRFSVSLDDDTFSRVEDYRINGNYSTRSKAVEALIMDGLLKTSPDVFSKAPKNEQPAAVGELSASEEKFFTALRAVPDEQRSLALSLCTVLVKELVRHQKAELKKEAPSPVEINR